VSTKGDKKKNYINIVNQKKKKNFVWGETEIKKKKKRLMVNRVTAKKKAD